MKKTLYLAITKIIFLTTLINPCVAVDAHEFIVGASLPLSGDLSYVGKEIIEGLQLYFAKAKNTSSAKVKFIFDDNKHQPSLAASSALNLLGTKKVNLIISLWDMTDIVAPIAERYQIPHIAIRAIPDIVKSHKYTIVFESTADSYVKKELEFLKILKYKTVSVISEETKGWNVINTALARGLKELNIALLNQEVLGNDYLSNRTSIINALKDRPDIILIHVNNPLTEQTVKFLKSYAPKQKFSGYLENIPRRDLVLGVPFIAFYNPAKWFEEKFYNYYNKSVISRGAHAYDIGNLIETILANENLLPDSEKIINKLTRYSLTEGATGKIFSNTPQVIENEVVIRVFCETGSKTLDPLVLESFNFVNRNDLCGNTNQAGL